MKTKKWAFAIGALSLIAASLAAPLSVSAETSSLTQSKQAKELEGVTIADFAYAGSGCPPNSADYLLSDDKKTLEILFSDFQANLQPKKMGVADYPPQNNCSVSVKMKIPPGYSASWHRVEHRGFADTSGGARGQLRARYYIPGEGGFDENRIFNFKKNYVRDYTVLHDSISTAYTRCGTNVPMTVNTRVRLYDKPTGYNALTVDSISKKVSTKLFFKYRKCD